MVIGVVLRLLTLYLTREMVDCNFLHKRYALLSMS
jgi:hypothetical protein